MQPEIDASQNPPDATVLPPDAAQKPVFSGTVSVQEVTIQGIPQFGQGIQITTSFTDESTAVPATFEEMPGSPFGCKVWEYTPAQAADVGTNQGTITVTSTDGTPSLPPCTFVAGAGYVCIGSMGVGGTIALVDATMGLWSFTDPATDFTGAVGRYLRFPGHPLLGTASFPIVNQPAANTIIIVSTSALPPGSIGATQPHVTVAGVGPTPGVADPGFLEDDDELTVSLQSGGDGNVDDFTKTFATATGGVGDDFTLDTASQSVITNIPTDGSTFTIGCGGAGGTCGTATGSILTITTTDTPIPAGASPVTMPAPTTKRVSVRCANLGVTSFTVPQAVADALMASGATRIQATFLRSNLQQADNAGTSAAVATTRVVAGHGVVGFSNP